VLADGGHAADDFVARNARKEGAGPFGAHLVEVGVADAAEGDVDLHVVLARRAAGDVHRFERFVGGVGAVSFDSHGFPLRELRHVAGVAGQVAMIRARTQGKPVGDCLGL